jgi:hypothetical protein
MGYRREVRRKQTDPTSIRLDALLDQTRKANPELVPQLVAEQWPLLPATGLNEFIAMDDDAAMHLLKEAGYELEHKRLLGDILYQLSVLETETERRRSLQQKAWLLLDYFCRLTRVVYFDAQLMRDALAKSLSRNDP